MIFAMIFQVMNIASICSFLFLEASTGEVMTQGYEQFEKWLQIELVVFGGTILAKMIFLFIRSFFIQKLVINAKNLMHSAESDYLESQCIMLGIFTTFVVPAVYLKFIMQQIEVSGKLVNDPAADIASVQYPLAVIQSLGMIIFLFVSFHRSPFDDLNLMAKYLTYVPKIFAGIVVLIFVVIPVFVVLDTLIQLGDVNGSAYKSALWIYCFTSIITTCFWIPTQLI
jgi:hypothetical protein